MIKIVEFNIFINFFNFKEFLFFVNMFQILKDGVFKNLKSLDILDVFINDLMIVFIFCFEDF